MKTRLRILTMVGGLAAISASAHATWYTNEGDFLAAIDGTFYLEDFDGWDIASPLDGTAFNWSAPGANGYGWDAFADEGLFSIPGAMSTNFSNEQIVLTFTGSPVTAFGLNIANTDFEANILAGDSTVLLSNGATQTISLGATEGFLGWVGTDVLTSATLSSINPEFVDNWVSADHIYTGAAAPVPEPATLAILGIGAAALLRRRRSRA